MRHTLTLFMALLLAPLAVAIAADAPAKKPHILAAEEAVERGPLVTGLAADSGGWPKLFHFRNSEAFFQAYSVEEYEKCTGDRTVGLIGKVFTEEKQELAPCVLERFSAYKARHPEQLVLAHYNGLAGDPRSMPSTYKACHWLHYEGCRLSRNADPASPELFVENAKLFRVPEPVGKKVDKAKKKSPPGEEPPIYGDDITICALDPSGRPDWNIYEYVHLTSVSPEGKLEVIRGWAGSKPRAWKAGQAWAAAINLEEPGGLAEVGRWRYNYSVTCPRDASGKRMIEVMSEDLGSRFTVHGPAAKLDGVEFDMMPFGLVLREDQVKRFGRGIDYDGDGKTDFADRDGVNQYNLGVVEFLEKLRRRLGDKKVVMIDMGRRGYKGICNGIESEGWPSPFDVELASWSAGMNEHRWWIERAAKPCLSYIHLKYVGDRMTGDRFQMPPSRKRLIYAAVTMLNGIVTVNWPQEPAKFATLAVPDELCRGRDGVYNWLGRPLEKPRMLALDAADAWMGKGADASFANRIRALDATVVAANDGGHPCIRARAAKQGQATFRFLLPGVSASPSGLVIRFRARAEEPLHGLPSSVARRIKMKPSRESDPTFSVRVGENVPWTWTDDEWFEASCYFPEYNGEPIAVEVEGAGAMLFAGFSAHCHADARVRLFEKGIVLANPSRAAYSFDLQKLYPGNSFRRLNGSDINSGAAVNGSVTLGERDGLFLVREDAGK